MTKKRKETENKIRAEITPDFVLDIYNKAKELEGDEQEILLKVAEVLSDHLGEEIISS